MVDDEGAVEWEEDDDDDDERGRFLLRKDIFLCYVILSQMISTYSSGVVQVIIM